MDNRATRIVKPLCMILTSVLFFLLLTMPFLVFSASVIIARLDLTLSSGYNCLAFSFNETDAFDMLIGSYQMMPCFFIAAGLLILMAIVSLFLLFAAIPNLLALKNLRIFSDRQNERIGKYADIAMIVHALSSIAVFILLLIFAQANPIKHEVYDYTIYRMNVGTGSILLMIFSVGCCIASLVVSRLKPLKDTSSAESMEN